MALMRALVAVGAVLLGASAFKAGGSRKEYRPADEFTPLPADTESAMVAKIVAERPQAFGGSSRPTWGKGWSEAEWYGWVAYRTLYPDFSPHPGYGAPSAALKRLRSQAAAVLRG